MSANQDETGFGTIQINKVLKHDKMYLVELDSFGTIQINKVLKHHNNRH